MLVVIKGAGDLATGVAVRLRHAGVSVVMTDLARPTAVRRTVSFCEAIPNGEATVEDVRALRAENAQAARTIAARGLVAVLIDPDATCVAALAPDVLVDAILAKRNTGTRMTDAPLVLALGPGFVAGRDCHAVIETMRGHDLGRVYWVGSAIPNTGVPGEVGGASAERLLRAPCDGVFCALRAIGDTVAPGDVLASVAGVPIRARIPGTLRGLLADGLVVHTGMKAGDIDPRAVPAHCYTVSDKARSLGGAVLEAIARGRSGNGEAGGTGRRED
ncbi:MAG: selenium-dependent molybdenum cofactor biosynthesis protein YqeB [Clostridia bacterium]